MPNTELVRHCCASLGMRTARCDTPEAQNEAMAHGSHSWGGTRVETLSGANVLADSVERQKGGAVMAAGPAHGSDCVGPVSSRRYRREEEDMSHGSGREVSTSYESCERRLYVTKPEKVDVGTRQCCESETVAYVDGTLPSTAKGWHPLEAMGNVWCEVSLSSCKGQWQANERVGERDESHERRMEYIRRVERPGYKKNGIVATACLGYWGIWNSLAIRSMCLMLIELWLQAENW